MSATCEIPAISAASPPATTSFIYRPELDALRFFAFLGVFFYHAMPNNAGAYASTGRLAPWIGAIFRSGAFGVDLFFALSAYLITVLLLREKEMRASLDVKSFYMRRILRIWPLYFTFLGLAIVLTWLDFRSQHLTARYIAGYSVMAGNWIYVAYGLPQSVTIPLWSISVEEQFYLLWPLAVRTSSRRSMAWIAVFLLVVSNCTRALLVLLVNRPVPGYALEYNTLVRLDPIALGILLALFLGYEAPRLSTIKRTALFSLGAATWIVVARHCEFNVHQPAKVLDNMLGRPAVALAGVAMLIAVLGLRGRHINPALVYLGKISYGLYVIHAFGQAVGYKVAGETAVPFTLAKHAGTTVLLGLLITVILAAASYRWLETPFLSLKKRFTYVASRAA